MMWWVTEMARSGWVRRTDTKKGDRRCIVERAISRGGLKVEAWAGGRSVVNVLSLVSGTFPISHERLVAANQRIAPQLTIAQLQRDWRTFIAMYRILGPTLLCSWLSIPWAKGLHSKSYLVPSGRQRQRQQP